MGIFTYESRYLRQIALGTHPNGAAILWARLGSGVLLVGVPLPPPPIPPNPCGPSGLDSLIYKIYPALVDT